MRPAALSRAELTLLWTGSLACAGASLAGLAPFSATEAFGFVSGGALFAASRWRPAALR